MAESSRVYQAADFVGLVSDVNVPDLRRLYEEIRGSAITVACSRLPTRDPVTGEVSMFWRANLSDTDEDVADEIVARHSGVPWVQRIAVIEEGPKVSTDLKRVVTSDPSTEGFKTWLTGAGDDPIVGRGEGSRLRFSFAGPSVQSCELAFVDPIEVFAGILIATGAWGHDDLLDVSVNYPATAVTPSVGHTGNCNLVDLGGGIGSYVPADGNGEFDLVTPAPIPSTSDSPVPYYWEMAYDTGLVTPAPLGGHYALFSFPVVAYFCKRLPIVAVDGGKAAFKVHGHRVGYVHPSARLVAKITKTSDGAGEVSGYVDARRRYV